MNGEWFPGHHEPIITPELFAAAHRGRIKGRTQGQEIFSAGKVRCGLCHRLMAIDQNGEGRKLYRCNAPGPGLRATPPDQHRAATGRRAWDCASSATTRSSRPPSAGSSSGPERRPPRPAEGRRSPTPDTGSRIWRASVASCCACSTTTASGPTCSPRRRPAWPPPSRRHGRRARRRQHGVRRSDDRRRRFDEVGRRARRPRRRDARGRPRRRSNDVSSSTSFSRRFRCYPITST